MKRVIFLAIFFLITCAEAKKVSDTMNLVVLKDYFNKTLAKNSSSERLQIRDKVSENINLVNLDNDIAYYEKLLSRFKTICATDNTNYLKCLENNIDVKDNKLIINGKELNTIFGVSLKHAKDPELVKLMHIQFLLLLTGKNYDLIYIPYQGKLKRPTYCLIKSNLNDEEKQKTLLGQLNERIGYAFSSLKQYSLCKIYEQTWYDLDTKKLPYENGIKDVSRVYGKTKINMIDSKSTDTVLLCCKTLSDTCNIVDIFEPNGPELKISLLESCEFDYAKKE